MAETASLDNACTDRTCSTCGYSGPDFYGASAECRDCKRERSKSNRVVIAQKVALADRLLDLIESLAERGVLSTAGLAGTQRGSASDATAAEPQIESQETRS